MFKIEILFCVFFGHSIFINAQNKEGEIEKVEIEIIKDRQITLPPASRTFDKVPPRPVENLNHSLTYDDVKNIVPFNLLEYRPSIRLLKLKNEPIEKIYGNYISAAYGNYSSPYLEGCFTNKRNRSRFYGLKLYHQSYGTGPVEESKSANSNTEVKAFGKLFLPSMVVKGNVGFDRIKSKYYGEMPDVFKGSGESQLYTIFNVGAEVYSTQIKKIFYQLGSNISYFKNDHESAESLVKLDLKSSYNLGSASQQLLFDVNYNWMNRVVKANSDLRNLLKIRLSYRFSPLDSLWVSLGVNVVFQNEPIQGNVKSDNFFPHLTIAYNWSKKVQLFAAITGDVDVVSLHQLWQENNWLSRELTLQNTHQVIDFSAGVKGAIHSQIIFQTGISVANFANLYSFENDIHLTNNTSPIPEQFKISYTDTKRTNVFAEMIFSSDKPFNLLLRGDYYNYSSDRVWHRPTYKLSLNSSYNIFDKIIIGLDIGVQGGMKALGLVEGNGAPIYGAIDTLAIQSATDLNTKVTYIFSKQFSVFFKANNILNTTYQSFLYYPVRGIHLMAGLSWNF